MTTELTTRKSEVAFGDTPHDIDGAWRLATAIQKSGLAPSSFKTPEAILVAMQYGAELGMKPMQSLQGIAVINGKPSLYGDALMALVLDSGRCEYVEECIEGTGEAMRAICKSKRKDQPHERVSTFSVADAKKASLWDKAGPWKQYPQRMLAMRARAFNLRDNFADVLRGMSVVEEVRDIPQTPTGGKVLTLDAIPDDESRVADNPDLQAQGEAELAEQETEHCDYGLLAKELAKCNTPSDVQGFMQYWENDEEAKRLCGVRLKEMLKPATALFDKE